MRRIFLAMGLLASLPAAAQERPVLTVYTYDSFVSEYGPGPQVEAAFEETCGCDLRFEAQGDGAALLSQLRLEGARTGADVVLGLDTNLMAEASATGLFARSELADADWDLPIAWDDPVFVPYDWGWFAFVHREDFEAPRSFTDLAASDASILIEDPRSSTPGLGLLLWVREAHGEGAAEIWEGLRDNIVTVTPGWSEAYNLFLEGEADMVLSYTTSPAYHLIAEDDDGFAAAKFEEGHYLQVEVAAAIDDSPRIDLARDFLAFLSEPAVQSVLPTTNWMYPAKVPPGGLPQGFETLIEVEETLMVPVPDVPAVSEEALETWLSALGR